jgi:transcription factor HY5
MSQSGANWFENADLSAFLNSPVTMEFPHSVPSASPVETDLNYYATSSPETFNSDASPYTSDVSQTPSPFDPALFNVGSPQHDISGPPLDVDPGLFDASNLTNPLLLQDLEKILSATPLQQLISPPLEFLPQESPKKRQRDIEFNGDITLSRDQLLTMSSKEIEEYVSAIKTKRTLTPSEEKDLKRQRRLVKNREYASQSRSRKKLYVDELEKQLEVARAETEGYKRQNHLLAEENRALKRQLGSIAEAIKKSQHGGMRTSGTTHVVNGLSTSPASSGMFANFTTIGGGRQSVVPSKTVSACLLAIFFMVFTFATFWDNHEPLGMTLFPNQNDGHKFSNRHLLELEELESTFPQASFPPIFESRKANAPPPRPRASTATPTTTHESRTTTSVSDLCYPLVYDATTNSSAWCSRLTLVTAS